MRAQNLAAVDLNLLVALDALLSERSVTRAAACVGISQPAMSRALGRLRALLDDPILVRGGQGMRPTPRAERLTKPLRRALGDLEDVLSDDDDFHPERARRTFTINMTDHGGLTLLPALMARLLVKAPGVDLQLTRPVLDVESTLEDGTTDLFVGAFIRPVPGLYSQRLFDESFVCVVRRDHPDVGRNLSLDQFVRLPHVLVTPRGSGRDGLVDEALARQKLARHVALRLPHFVVAPLVVTQSNLILTAPERVARFMVKTGGLRIVKPPLEIGGFTVHQVWHERHKRDPAHAWLRATIAHVARRV